MIKLLGLGPQGFLLAGSMEAGDFNSIASRSFLPCLLVCSQLTFDLQHMLSITITNPDDDFLTALEFLIVRINCDFPIWKEQQHTNVNAILVD